MMNAPGWAAMEMEIWEMPSWVSCSFESLPEGSMAYPYAMRTMDVPSALMDVECQ